MINSKNIKTINHLKSLKETLLNKRLAELVEEPSRFDRYHLSTCDILLDYSKNHINSEVMDLLIQVAEDAQVGDTDALNGTNPRASFVGNQINKMIFEFL